MNKKIGVALVFILVSISLFTTISAEVCTEFNYSNWSNCEDGKQTRTIISSSPSGCTGGDSVLEQGCASSSSTSYADRGFMCLVDKVKDDCSGAKTVEEAAFTVLSSAPNVSKSCLAKLKSFEKNGNCFGSTSDCSIRDTALVILAYNHVGEESTKYVDWLKNQTIIASDLIWYLQQNSDGETECEASYDGDQHKFTASENKKLSGSAGPCLDLTYAKYWFLVNPNCYGKNISIACTKNFMLSLMYKEPISSGPLYVLSEPKEGPANSQINIFIKSICFGKGQCSYEDTAWAVLALKKSGINIDDYLPYLISSSELNSQFLPNAFLNMIVSFSEFGSKLIAEQESGYWEASYSAHNRYYDTALALLSLEKSNQEQVESARRWLQNLGQGPDGCWNSGSITETAFALWALEHKPSSISPNTPTVNPLPECAASNFFCVPSSNCDSTEKLNNYVCGSISESCCKIDKSLERTCSDIGGITCSSGTECSKLTEQTKDTNNCCTGTCEAIPSSTETQCSANGGTCKSKCIGTQEETDFECGDSGICCVAKKSEPKPEKKSLWWLWLILIILIILIIMAILKRDKIKTWVYKKKSGFKDEDSSDLGKGGPSYPSSPGMQRRGPPVRPLPTMNRPGYPPVNRPMGPQSPPRLQGPPVGGVANK